MCLSPVTTIIRLSVLYGVSTLVETFKNSLRESDTTGQQPQYPGVRASLRSVVIRAGSTGSTLHRSLPTDEVRYVTVRFWSTVYPGRDGNMPLPVQIPKVNEL